MSIPEWELKEGADSPQTYQFDNVNPKLVFLLALAVGVLAVVVIYFGYVAVNAAMDAGIIPHPPRLQGLIDQVG